MAAIIVFGVLCAMVLGFVIYAMVHKRKGFPEEYTGELGIPGFTFRSGMKPRDPESEQRDPAP